MISISNYHLEYNTEEDVYYVYTVEIVICPVCGHPHLTLKGRRKRILIKPGDNKICLKIRRLRCENCNKIHHELPDTIVPYKRHCAETIEEIITEKVSNATACYESTINRIWAWWAAMHLYIEKLLESLKEKYGIYLTKEKKLAEIVRALVNTHLWPGTRSVLTPRWT